ncbi:MAG TPA: hypothetical protein PKA74_09075 [Bauldia sp.]|nr:hypothetical protein [Bauldia sp.]
MSGSPDIHAHLGPFSGLVAAADAMRPLFPSAPPGAATRAKARSVLAFTIGDETAQDVRRGETWTRDGVRGEALSWSVGFGPRTEAWLFTPEGATGRLPALVALHDHGHFKALGKEKIADGPGALPASLVAFRDMYYGGRAFVGPLVRRGFAVLVPDVFLWGSRRFPLDVMPEAEHVLADPIARMIDPDGPESDTRRYNGAAYLHEHLVSKYCTVLGTSFAGIVAYEDRVALNTLRALPGVDPARVGTIGLSGGGCRAALLAGTSDHVAATVIAGMMTTYAGLLDHCIAPHTWMLFPPGWGAHGDWPDLAAASAPSPLLVQYLLGDAQFTREGMEAADRKLAAHYASAGAAGAYAGSFFDGPHRFDVAMQEEAFDWLARHLGPSPA